MTDLRTRAESSKKGLFALWTFLIALATALAMFIPAIITGHGYFIFYGDFNVQQIPFYQYCHNAVRSLDFGWSWESDLGSNFIGSYSFYLLGSPFFWLTLPFPNHIVPYLMGPLLILKFSCAAVTAYLFIRHFTARNETAMIGGLLYAFCGFSVYNIFFNHFHEAIVLFPLLLLSIERFNSHRSRGFVALMVFFTALNNYFFFFGMVLFVVIYWLIRVLSGSFKFKFSEFALLSFECVLGVAMASAILLPSILSVLQNDRLGSYLVGWNSVLYGNNQIFLNVIQCFFFPPDLPARPVFFPHADVKWASLGGWLPLFGMVGTFCFLQSEKKGTWLRRVLFASIFIALVPGLNSAFQLFNIQYYARWFYMPILMMCLATVIAFEDTSVNWKSAWKWNMSITLGFALVIGLAPNGIEDGKITGFGLYTDASTNPLKFILQSVKSRITEGGAEVEGNIYDLRFWVTVAISVLSLIIVKAMLPSIIAKRRSIYKVIIPTVCCVSVIYSTFFIMSGQSLSADIENVVIDGVIEGNVDLPIANDEFARIDVYNGEDNTGYALGYSSINYFHSIVPGSVTSFYEFIGEERSVASRPTTKVYGARSLLSVKYLLDPVADNDEEDYNFQRDDGKMLPYYSYCGEQNGYKIYKNECYIPMGFTYDYFVTEEQALHYSDYTYSDFYDDGVNYESNNHRNFADLMMLKALVVDQKDAVKISAVLDNLGDDYNIGTKDENKQTMDFSYTAFRDDCADRAAVSAYSFQYDSDGFKAKIELDRRNYVFFSVPYEEGWTAYVNGQKTEIVRVNEGFMAVLAPKGDNEIVFQYTTPGIKTGLLITVISALVLIVYIVVIIVKRVFRPAPTPDYPEGEIIATRATLYEAAVFAIENDSDDYLLEEIDRNKIDAYHGVSGGFNFDESVFDEVEEFRIQTAEIKDEEPETVEEVHEGDLREAETNAEESDEGSDNAE